MTIYDVCMCEHECMTIFIPIIYLYIFSIFSIKLAHLLNRNILDTVYEFFFLNSTLSIHIVEFKRKRKLLKKINDKR